MKVLYTPHLPTMFSLIPTGKLLFESMFIHLLELKALHLLSSENNPLNAAYCSSVSEDGLERQHVEGNVVTANKASVSSWYSGYTVTL